MSATTVRTPQDYEDAYGAYYAEAAEEVRAGRVGELENAVLSARLAVVPEYRRRRPARR